MTRELKFLVPQASRARVAAELARGSAAPRRASCVVVELDTADGRLSQAGLAWCLRRDGRRWIQTLQADDGNGRACFVHEVVLPAGIPDPSAHAGTPQGDRLIGLLRQAQAEGFETDERLRSELRRTTRRIATKGAIVDVTLEEGRLVAPGASRRIRAIEFAWISGPLPALPGLAERWRKRFALVHDPRSAAELEDLVADPGRARARKALRPSYAQGATAIEAFGAVLDECLAQITHNAIGLVDGDPVQRSEHVHQLRVGIRRLRSALRSFQGWVPAPPAERVEGLRSLFTTLGLCRDADVLGKGVLIELAKAGAPALRLPPGPAGPDPAAVVQADAAQSNLLAWITWRVALVQDAPAQPGNADARGFCRQVERRLGRWHARIAADWKAFAELDDAGLHALRKRIKRQRYAVEFFRPLLNRRRVDRYVDILAAIQDRMGALNDLFVARGRYQASAEPDPATWFALGWLAARIEEVRALAGPELARLAKADPPVR